MLLCEYTETMLIVMWILKRMLQKYWTLLKECVLAHHSWYIYHVQIFTQTLSFFIINLKQSKNKFTFSFLNKISHCRPIFSWPPRLRRSGLLSLDSLGRWPLGPQALEPLTSLFVGMVLSILYLRTVIFYDIVLLNLDGRLLLHEMFCVECCKL